VFTASSALYAQADRLPRKLSQSPLGVAASSASVTGSISGPAPEL